MSRGFLPISKVTEETGYETESSDNLSPWMRNMVNRLNQPTAVEQARSRQSSIVNDVTSYIKGTKRYATVEDAVVDMRQRTGLDKYLETIKSANVSGKKKTAQEIIDIINSEDNSENNVEDSSNTYKIPKTFLKYDCAEDIINFIKNTIKNKHGAGVSVPQIQHDILHNFAPKRCGITEQDLCEEDVVTFINDCIKEEVDKLGPADLSLNIGLGVGKETDHSGDEDYFAGLNPTKD